MPFFKDSDQLNTVARDLLTRVQEEIPSASDSIARSHLVIRLATTDPVTEFTLNGRKRPVDVLYGPTRLRPTLDLSLKADTLHAILLDEISLTKAVSSGLIEAVTDEEILAAQRFLASKEGIFCEPASAASVAGVRKLAAAGRLTAGQRLVCVLTGSGLKDPQIALAQASTPPEVEAEVTEVESMLGWTSRR